MKTRNPNAETGRNAKCRKNCVRRPRRIKRRLKSKRQAVLDVLKLWSANELARRSSNPE